MMKLFQSLTLRELEAEIFSLLISENPEIKTERDQKKARYHARQMFQGVYQRKISNFDQMTDLSKKLRTRLKEKITLYQPKLVEQQTSDDGTLKFLWQLEDGKTIESVMIPRIDEEGVQRITACISSQVGCAMGCTFCLTASQGLERHLFVHEMVAQVLELRRVAPISHLVFMGMGEPLHNLENTIKTCEIVLEEWGLNFSKRKVTVSTSGLADALEEFSRRMDVSLAVSLNATTNSSRQHIMPVNKAWNIERILATCRNLPLSKYRRITFEYVLLSGFNDSLADAKRLGELVQGIPCKVNLIPFNPHFGSEFERPTDSVVASFQEVLLKQGVCTSIRQSRGQDILAACGQLRSRYNEKEAHTYA